MRDSVSIYCDESCHLEKDRQRAMLLGCVWLPSKEVRAATGQIKQIKEQHHAEGELKWGKVSPSRLPFFLSIVDWFFASPNLHFRCLVVPDKSILDHAAFNQGSHDEFYYKMHFSLLSKVLDPSLSHDIYLDIKDTRSKFKIKNLAEILCNDRYDFTQQMIREIQHVRSHEVALLQISDFLLGAVSYKHRGLNTSEAKQAVIARIEQYHQRSLLHSTPLSEGKFNVFVWRPRKVVAA